MKIIKEPSEVREYIRQKGLNREEIGFVPTMGYLHEGHLSLVRRCKQENSFCVVSIFVNPLQFGPSEDLAAYPRDFDRDSALLEKEGVDLLFAPREEDMYYPDFSTVVKENKLSRYMCGAFRPGHFDGVCTVVLKLFNIVQPGRAYFGQKDYQQLQVLKRMVRDLNVPVEVIGCPIVRDHDGLALSSRNVYLTEEQRKEALKIPKALEEAERLFKSGVKDVKALEAKVREILSEGDGLKVQYVEIRDAENLEEVNEIKGKVVIAVAAYVGKARLIDNKILES
ncbi:pantothenate synthetase [Thermovirga lienii DSM 17291]|uniref:Pantothenate synthetase n=1 Tax=Thermovirga lienii (strain ATCC BAA-1197 / DSM 17291 / Cas60314) TaxID=580340 RepID=G7V5R5_THELD|nr:pantoate--beta-alanine ligase [Thermovirga lienii]AER66975.1 pantothenate synthetase [Thermovirga lienii DSM 17291]